MAWNGIGLSTASLLCLCGFAAGNLHGATWAVPGVMNGTDNGNHWTTELRVQNRDSKPIGVSLVFWAQGADAASERSTVVLDPGQTLAYKNVLREVWQLEDQRGAVLVDTDGAATVTAFRYTDERDAVLGQALVAKPADEWLSGALLGDLIWLAQTADYDSGVWIVSGTDGARAEVVFFDAANTELARTTVEGPARSRWLALSDFGIQDQPVVRAQVRFLAGSGAATSEIAHLPTGDRMGADAVVVDQLQNDLSVHPAVRNAAFRTDLRLYNPLQRDVTVSVTWNGKFFNFPVAAGGVLQVDDVAQALKMEGDQQGILRITNSYKVVALARLVRLNEDGSAGPGEFLEPQLTTEVGGASSPWLLAGIPAQADALFLSLRRGAAGTETQVRIADQTGSEVAATVEPITFATIESQKLVDLLQLAALPALPPNAAISVIAQAGLVDPAILALLHGSGDIAHTTPLRTVAENACVGPVIQTFEADRKTLDEAGPVTLNWRTQQADSVTLSLDGEAREPSGSATVDLAETATVILTASNACGDVTRELLLAVGPPLLTQAQALAQTDAGSGSPGQLVRFTVGSIAEPERVASIHFQTSSGQSGEAEVEGVDSEGRLYAVVPYIWIDSAARYVQGDVTASVVWDDGRTFEGLPFRILPLTPPEDPLGMFRTMLDNLADMAATSDSQLRTEGVGSFADSQKTGTAATSAALRKLADDLGAKGSGRLFYSTDTTGSTAVSATITQQDLADLMAYELNVRDTEARLTLTLAPETVAKADGIREAGGARDAGSCLWAKEPYIPICKALNFREMLEAGSSARAHEFAKQVFSDLPPSLEQQGEQAVRDWVFKKLAKLPLYALAKRIESYANYVNLYCLIRPIELKKFFLITQPPRKGTSKLKEVMYSRYDNQPTLVQVNALLTPHYTASNIRGKLIAKEAGYIAKQLSSNKFAQSLAKAGVQAFLEVAQGDLELNAIETAAKALNFKESQPYQIGKCDLYNFYPLHPRNSTKAQPAVRVASGYVQGEDNFFYLGSKMKSSADMCIVPIPDHFIFADTVEQDSKARRQRECKYLSTVGISGRSVRRAAEDSTAGVFELPDFTDDVNVGPSEGVLRAGASTTAAAYSGAHPVGWNPTFTQVTDVPWVQQQSAGPASARVVVKKLGKNKWSFEGSSNGDNVPTGPYTSVPYNGDALLDLDLTIPENRSATYTLKMEGKVQTLSGLCALSLNMANGSKGAGGNNYGNGIYEGSPRLLSYSFTAESESPSAFVTLAIYASSGAPTASSCKATGTIELTIPEE